MSDTTETLTADRPSSDAPPRPAPVMRSPIAPHHRRQGATLAIEEGWEVAHRYQDGDGERSAIREGLAIAETTWQGKTAARGAVNPALASLPQPLGATLARISRHW